MPRIWARDDIKILGLPIAEICSKRWTDPRQRQLFKNIMYVGALSALFDMDPNESRDILEFLFAHQEKPQFVYEHVWRPGDLMLWDNRSCLHARTDFDPNERRRLRRVTMLGDKPYE